VILTASLRHERHRCFSQDQQGRCCGFLFYCGLSFASWASRIPDIKLKLHLNDAALGGLLICFTGGSMLSMPFSGWLVKIREQEHCYRRSALLSRLHWYYLDWRIQYGSWYRYCWCFGFLGNLCNISINTQAVGVESCIQALYHGFFSWNMEPGRFYRRRDRYVDGIQKHRSLAFYFICLRRIGIDGISQPALYCY
jgi:hypothetical protein